MSLGDRFDHTQAVPGTSIGLSTPEGMRDRARLHTASRATDAGDCRELLLMLGLIEQGCPDDTVIQAEETTER